MSVPPFRPAVVLLAIVLAGCGSKSERIAEHLKQGDAYARQADWDKAGVEVRNVLQMDPRNARAYYLGGQIEEGRREAQRAYGYYFRAAELDPGAADAQIGMARLFMLSGDDARAAKTVATVLAAHPDDLGAQTLDAALTARRGDTTAAMTRANRIIASAARIPAETSLLLAGLYANEHHYAQAQKIVETALQAEPHNPTLLAVAAQLCGAQADDPVLRAKAVAYYRDATAAAPKNADIWNAWARLHAGRGELDDAERVLRDAMRMQPDDSARALALVDFLAAQRGVAAAEAEYKRLIAERPNDPALRFGLARLYRDGHRTAEAGQVLRDIVVRNGTAPSGLAARDLLAADALAAGRQEEGKALIEEVLRANPRDGGALLLRGRILVAEGRARDAILDLRSAVKDQPGSPELVGLLARAHHMAKEPELAREVLADAVKFKPEDPALHLLLAADMADTGDRESALGELDGAIAKSPADARLYELKARLQAAANDPAGAEASLRALQQQRPSDPGAYIRVGELLAAQSRYEPALAEFDAAARIAPESPQALAGVIATLTAQQRYAEARRRLDQVIAQRPDAPLPYRLKGEVALLQHDAATARPAFERAIALAPHAASGYQGLARALSEQKDLAAALQVLDRGIVADPADLSTQALRADWLLRAGRLADARAAYEQLVRLAPDNDVFTNNLAYLLADAHADAADLQRALALAQRFEHSSNPGYIDSLAWAHYRLGHYAEASALLERALQRTPDASLLQLHWGMAQARLGQAERGRGAIQKALRAAPALADADEARRLVGAG